MNEKIILQILVLILGLVIGNFVGRILWLKKQIKEMNKKGD